MQAIGPLKPVLKAPPAPIRRVRHVCLLASFLWIPMALLGCQTDKQERFDEYTKEGVRLFQAGKYVDARDHFELALALEPKDANHLYDLGQ